MIHLKINYEASLAILEREVEGEILSIVAVANFVVDHRYVDGGRCKNLMPAFKSVFDNP